MSPSARWVIVSHCLVAGLALAADPCPQNRCASSEAALRAAERAYQSFAFQRCVTLLTPWSAPGDTQLAAEHAKVELYLGLCHFFLQRREEAEQHFEAALIVEPTTQLPPFTSPKIQAAYSVVAARVRERREREEASARVEAPPPVPPPLPASVAVAAVPQAPSSWLERHPLGVWFSWRAAGLSQVQDGAAGDRYLAAGWTFNDLALNADLRLGKRSGLSLSGGREARSASGAAGATTTLALYRLSGGAWLEAKLSRWTLRGAVAYRVHQLPLLQGTTALRLVSATWHGPALGGAAALEVSSRLTLEAALDYAHGFGDIQCLSLAPEAWLSLGQVGRARLLAGLQYGWESTWWRTIAATDGVERRHRVGLALKVEL